MEPDPYTVTHAGRVLCDALEMQEDFKLLGRWVKFLQFSENGCMEWSGRLNERGYGQFSIKNHTHLAHRVAYALANGRWPHKDLLVCHSCNNRCCVNPEHLYEGGHEANMEDRYVRHGYRWKNQFGHG
jgi:hypothetical protein